MSYSGISACFYASASVFILYYCYCDNCSCCYYCYQYFQFLPRDAMLSVVYAVVVCLSVCVSVCLSHSGIVSKLLNIVSWK